MKGMRRWVAIMIGAGVLLVGCTKREYTVRDYESMSIFEYLELPDEELNVGIAALILSKEFYSGIRFMPYLELIDEAAYRVQYYVRGSSDPVRRIAAINTVLFRDMGFRYDTNDYMGKQQYNHFISSVIDRRTGVCSSLPLLYIIVAERLNYPVYAVDAPHHTFCRYVYTDEKGNEKYINIEPTGGGGEVPDIIYIDDMDIPLRAYRNGVYMRTLSKKEYIASLLNYNAATYMYQGRYDKAIGYLERLVGIYPQSSFNHKILSICYKKVCNSLPTPQERKPYYFKALKHQRISQNLGLAPPPPEDYWKNQQNNNTGSISTREVDGIITVEDMSYRERVKKLKEQYRDYFQ